MKANVNNGVFKSLFLHALLLAAMLLSLDFSKVIEVQSASAAPTPIIEATFIDSNVLAQKKREQQQAEAAARAKQERERQARIKREQARKERAEREKRIKQKQALEEKRKQEQAQREERERQQRAKEQAERAKQEKLEAQRKAQEALQREQERAMQEQLRAEQAARAAQQERRVLSETDKYISLIKDAIQRNLIFEEGGNKKECRLNIRLSQTGLVFDVKILSGDAALCRAAQAAVLRPSSLPVSKDPAVYAKLKDFNLTVEL